MVQSVIKKRGRNELGKKVRSDIVFCVDVSASMTPCIDGVKENIEKFVSSVGSDPEMSIDWRLGILGHRSDHNTISFFKKDFTKDVDDFKIALSKLIPASSEANLPALDWSLDFDWDQDSHKFIVMFTDEPVDGGWDPQKSKDKLDELKQKVGDIGASVHVISLGTCREYSEIASLDKCYEYPLPGHNDFSEVSFPEIMRKIGTTVGLSSKGRVNRQRSVKKDIYGISSISSIEKL